MEKEIVDSRSSPDQNTGEFECNICLQLARDPVVTPCGHVFCWPCLYKWLYSYSESQNCAVCRAVLKEKVLIRINDSGTTQSDALWSTDVPHCPAASRFASFGALIASYFNHVMSRAFPDASIHETTSGSPHLFKITGNCL